MKKGWKIFWITIGVLGIVGIAAILGALVCGVSFYDVFTETQVVQTYVDDDEDEIPMAQTVPSMEEVDEYEGIKNLSIETNCCRILVQGDRNDTVRIDSSRLRGNKVDVSVENENGTLIVRASGTEHHLIRRNENRYGTLRILVPMDLIFDKIDLRSEIGEITLNRVEGNQLTVDVVEGEVSFTGALNGDASVKCEGGEAELTLMGLETDFNYNLECEMGEIEIGAFEIESLSEIQTMENGAEKNINIHCKGGSASVDFK